MEWRISGSRSRGPRMAIHVDGSSQYLTQATLLDTVPAAIAIMFRFIPDVTIDSGLASPVYILQKQNVVVQDRIQIFFEDTTGKIVMFTEQANAGNKLLGSVKVSWTAGTEYHVVFTWDTTNGKRIFVDGSLDTSDGVETTLMGNGTAEDFFLGSTSSPSLYFDGKIADFRVYNRIMTTTEIAIIAGSLGKDNIVNGLIAHWLMNEGPDGGTASGADSLVDISGQENHGTPNNSPLYRAGRLKVARPKVLI